MMLHIYGGGLAEKPTQYACYPGTNTYMPLGQQMDYFKKHNRLPPTNVDFDRERAALAEKLGLRQTHPDKTKH